MGIPELSILTNIVEYCKEPNPDYRPETDIELSDNEAAINRNIGKLTPTKDVAGIISVDIDSVENSRLSRYPAQYMRRIQS